MLSAAKLRRVGQLLSASLLLLACSASHPCLADSLVLDASLDASEYVIGQPVMLFLSATNVGQSAIEDIGPLAPNYGRLRLLVFRAGEETPMVDYANSITSFYSQEGMKLDPGQEACELVNLLEHFGTWPPKKDWLGPVLFERSLPPGEYSLQCFFRARTGVRKDLGPLTVQGPTRRFRVLKERAAKAPLRGLEKLRRSSSWVDNTIIAEQARACQEQLPDLTNSPYFLKVFECASFGLHDDELATLVAELRKRSGTERWSPTLGWAVAARPVHTAEERMRQLEGLGPLGTVDQRIVNAWRLRLEQGLYFYRSH